MIVRAVGEDDYDWILDLNRANEIATSPLDKTKLASMVTASFAAVALPQAAFMLSFDQNAAYDSPNFVWFRQRVSRFVYVDRIVVSEHERGGGIARAFYEGLFDAARDAKHTQIVCEVNFDPPNPASDAFHARLGFTAMGEARLENGKGVRYLKRDL